ncbi:hypothetical protein DERF_001886 [Dermatophagoides farinae]|uniref:Uncharacterized protein n=1 Tax=Dermatophagoides farinae TaxID=6954 RepID=A0A922IBT5_DERFA|nr:hypothetical protein DERF_001886 [Dermatophagoides farinae]
MGIKEAVNSEYLNSRFGQAAKTSQKKTPPLTFVFVMKSFYGSCYYGHDIIIGLSMMTVDHESG